jgi:hypothetical protein
MWWLCYRNEGKLVGVAVIEAPSIYHARMQAAVRGIGRAADYAEGKEVAAEHAALIPQDCISRLLSPQEAQQLIERIGSALTQGTPPPRSRTRTKTDADVAPYIKFRH